MASRPFKGSPILGVLAMSDVKQVEQTEGIEGEQVQEAKAPRTITTVTMTDGRVVEFAGKRKMLKEVIQTPEGVAVRFDFLDGNTLLAVVPQQHVIYAAGHGYAQKLGDEVAGAKDEAGNPASAEDMFLAVEALHTRLTNSDSWNSVRTAGEGSGVSGAGIVLRAIAEVNGKDIATIKAFMDKKMATAAAAGQKLTRKMLYDSFKQPGTPTAAVIERLEAERAAKAPAKDAPVVSAADLMAEMG
jgi:hypothetical protein